ncbi:MAG: hypothetical protein IJB98_00505, partial [Clostridia bacterium]|nr:hypothetical protein [Clostridia bacterium]
HNQEEWQRSRQIIDNLISNTYEDASSYALVKRDDIDALEEKAEKAEQQLEELQEQIEDGTLVEAKNSESEESFAQPQSSVIIEHDEEIIPWATFTSQSKNDSDEKEENEEEVTYSWAPEIDVRETEEESVLVSYAPNGEELAAVVTTKEENEDVQESEEEVVNEAQASLFEKPEDVFDEEIDVEKLEAEYLSEEDENTEEQVEEFDNIENIETSDDDSYDILELLGHSVKNEVSPTIFPEEPEVSKVEESSKEEIDEEPEEVSPFSFRMEDFVTKSKTSYFESQEVLDPTPDYTAPEMKIDGIEESHEEVDEESADVEFIEDDEKADEIYEPETDFATPVYHNFGESSFEQNFNHKIEQDDDQNDDEIYSPFVQEEQTAIVDDELKLFGEDLFEDNEDYVVNNEEKTEEVSEIQENEEIKTVACKKEFEDVEIQSNQQVMDFYKSTENYENITPKYTDEEYKEKLTSIITYGDYDKQEKPQEQNFEYIPSPAPSSEVYSQKSMDYTELKTDFEKEGLVVRPHHKMVKESKHTRSYIESNKLNMVNSWTSFGIIACIVALTYLIMSNYGASTHAYNFSYKYFLIGISCVAVIPVIYTMIYFINPYKKKPARYASRIYMLFAILLTVQLLLIIYCINLQLGFYSFAQPNYNHLLWIVPSLLSLYPLADAILHTVYFNSKNFHV